MFARTAAVIEIGERGMLLGAGIRDPRFGTSAKTTAIRPVVEAIERRVLLSSIALDPTFNFHRVRVGHHVARRGCRHRLRCGLP